MTLTLELPPEVEAQGMPLADYFQDVVRREIEPVLAKDEGERPIHELPDDEWLRHFQASRD